MGCRTLSDVIAVAGAGGFGASLVLIHIYVKPMKRLLQALFAVGFAGGLFLMVTQVSAQSCTAQILLVMAIKPYAAVAKHPL